MLPSPNGATQSYRASELTDGYVLAGALRNAQATVRLADELDGSAPIAVIAAGERWGIHNGPLRPAVEDLLGAGAILDSLAADHPSWVLSPEAAAARAAFVSARPDLTMALRSSASGRELCDQWGWEDDVQTCAQLDADEKGAVLVDGAFRPGGK